MRARGREAPLGGAREGFRAGGPVPRLCRVLRLFRLRRLLRSIRVRILLVTALAVLAVATIAVTTLIAFAMVSIQLVMVVMSMVMVFLLIFGIRCHGSSEAAPRRGTTARAWEHLCVPTDDPGAQETRTHGRQDHNGVVHETSPPGDSSMKKTIDLAIRTGMAHRRRKASASARMGRWAHRAAVRPFGVRRDRTCRAGERSPDP